MYTGDRTIEPIDILLIEDNPADIRFTRESLKESKIRNQLQVYADGQSAIDFLMECLETDAKLPNLILLDLNMPGMSGHDVLKKLKSHRKLRRIPVVVLTTSRAEEDILRSYDLHVNCYVTKPIDLDQFTKVVQSIQEFWFSIVTMPAPI